MRVLLVEDKTDELQVESGVLSTCGFRRAEPRQTATGRSFVAAGCLREAMDFVANAGPWDGLLCDLKIPVNRNQDPVDFLGFDVIAAFGKTYPDSGICLGMTRYPRKHEPGVVGPAIEPWLARRDTPPVPPQGLFWTDDPGVWNQDPICIVPKGLHPVQDLSGRLERYAMPLIEAKARLLEGIADWQRVVDQRTGEIQGTPPLNRDFLSRMILPAHELIQRLRCRHTNSARYWRPVWECLRDEFVREIRPQAQAITPRTKLGRLYLRWVLEAEPTDDAWGSDDVRAAKNVLAADDPSGPISWSKLIGIGQKGAMFSHERDLACLGFMRATWDKGARPERIDYDLCRQGPLDWGRVAVDRPVPGRTDVILTLHDGMSRLAQDMLNLTGYSGQDIPSNQGLRLWPRV